MPSQWYQLPIHRGLNDRLPLLIHERNSCQKYPLVKEIFLTAGLLDAIRRTVARSQRTRVIRTLPLHGRTICVSLGDGGASDRIQGCGSIKTNGRRTSLTLVALTFRSLAVSLTPRPSFCAARMRSILNGVVLGLPRRLPDDRARSRPAITRSRIIARSNSLDTERGVDGKRLWKLEDIHSGRVSLRLCMTTTCTCTPTGVPWRYRYLSDFVLN